MIKNYNILLMLSFVAVLLVGCNATNRATKKIERIVAKHPELVRVDTVKVLEQIVTTEYRDSIVVEKTDTVVIENEKWRVKIVDRVDSFFVDVYIPSDTVYKEVRVPYRTIEPIRIVKQKKDALAIAVIALCVLLFILLLRK